MKAPLSLVALLAFFFASCGPTVRTSQPTSADLSKYSTFAYLPNALVDVEGLESEELSGEVVEAVRKQLQQVGYRVDRDDPDLLVLLSVKQDTEVETRRDPVYGSAYSAYPYTNGVYGVSPYYNDYYYNGYDAYGADIVGYDVDTYRYKTGTLILNLVDRATKNTVWKAVSEKAIYDGNVSPSDIAMMVDDMFAEFPVEDGVASL